jgi:membrane protein implicated in regulation of membrane protease activity
MNRNEKLAALAASLLLTALTLWLVLQALAVFMPLWKGLSTAARRDVQFGFYAVFSLMCLVFTLRHLRKRRGGARQPDQGE